MKAYKHILYLSLTLLVTLFQIGAIQTLSDHTLIALPLILLLLYLIFFGLRFTLVHVILSGFLLDLFSPSFFGMNIILLVILITLGSLLIKSLLSQKSILPLFSLTLFSTFFFFIMQELVEYSSDIISGIPHDQFFSFSFFFWTCVCAFINGVAISMLYKLFSMRKPYKLKPYIVH